MKCRNSYIITPIIIVLATACNVIYDEKMRIEVALNKADANRFQLETVLRHYKNDALHLKAAQFLIINMPYHSYYIGSELTKIIDIFQRASGRQKSDIQHIIDSCNKENGVFQTEKLNRKNDIKTIDSIIITHHIDETFRAWYEYPWGKNVSFDALCEYVLPYRIGDEPPSCWRTKIMEEWKPFTDSIRNMPFAEDPFQVAKLVFQKMCQRHVVFTGAFPYSPHLGPQIVDWNVGYCRDLADVIIYTFRALCLPCAVDFIASTDYNTSHLWVSIKDSHGETWMIDYASKEMKPARGYDRVKGKVFRETFSLNWEMVEKMRESKEEIVPPFVAPKFKDVTKEYADEHMIEHMAIKESEVAGHFEDGKRYYLCVPQRMKWLPVDWAFAKEGKVTFGYFKAGVAACICQYRDGKLLPCSSPFRTKIHDETPSLQPFYTDGQEEMVTLYAKFPPVDELHLGKMVGGFFEGSNNSSFNTIDTLFIINTPPSQIINIEQTFDSNKRYRYVRYKGPASSFCDVGEIAFYKSSDETTPLQGKIIGYPLTQGKPSSDYRRAMDGDPYTYYICGEQGRGWVGLDLGKPSTIGKVYYTPRNRQSFIKQGNTYELYWWENGFWHSAGKKVAKDYCLSYNVPKGALLFLRDMTEHKKERVFEYIDGKQCWW